MIITIIGISKNTIQAPAMNFVTPKIIMVIKVTSAPKPFTKALKCHPAFLSVTGIGSKGKTVNILSKLSKSYKRSFIDPVKGEKIIFSQSYGLANLQTKENITSKTLFNIGSISKTFMTNTLLALMEENKLSLNDNLEKYFSLISREPFFLI